MPEGRCEESGTEVSAQECEAGNQGAVGIVMRITGGLQEDRTHWRKHFVGCPVIKLNGVAVEHVCEADDVAGYIVVACYGPNKKLLLDESGQKIKTERREGRVEIIGPSSQ